jgi:beta-glucosidase
MLGRSPRVPRAPLAAAVAVLASVLAVPLAARAQGPGGVPARVPYRDPRAPIAARVRDLLGRMTLEEKAAQLRAMWIGKAAFLDSSGTFSPGKAATALADGIGQIARPGDTFGTPRLRTERMRGLEETVTLVNAIQRHLVERTRLGVPALFHEETAHGYAERGATIFPIPPGLASTWDPPLVEQAFAVAAREARLRGATVALSPVLDLARDPRYGRVEEFFGEDPYLVAQMGIASVRGQQGHARPLAPDKVFVTLKHFVHAVPQGGLNIAPADVSERSLRETYLVPFEQVIRAAEPAVIMPSYNEVGGVPAHASRELLLETGRKRLRFRGAYFSDYGGVTNLVTQHHVAATNDEAAILALNAGVDAELPDGQAYARLPALVRAGQVREARVDSAVARVLRLKFEAGLFEHPYLDLQRAVRETNTPADVALARTVAQRSIVLLKNDGVLPLDPRATLRLAVVGPNAEAPLLGGYSGINPKAVGILAGVRAAAGQGIAVEYAEGVRITETAGSRRESMPIALPKPEENAARIAEAVRVARRADVVLLVVGDTPDITREATSRGAPGDRSTLGLFGDQDALVDSILATGKPVVALLINGRALAVTRLAETANALVEGWYLGQEGGHAFADVLFGAVNPGGKLPVSFPRAVGALPVYYDRHPTADVNVYVEGARTPLFPFGFGLSYTTFDLGAPRLARQRIAVGDTALVDVEVTNTGRRAGDEVVQLYVRDDVSSVPRPVLELKGSERVTLAPGEKRTVRFTLPPDALAFWNIDMRRVVEPGTFTISTGPSSATLKSATLTVY